MIQDFVLDSVGCDCCSGDVMDLCSRIVSDVMQDVCSRRIVSDVIQDSVF